MSYKHSKARRAFDSAVKNAVGEALTIQRFPQVRAATSSSSSRLLGAYYVLVFAQLETYIGDIIEDSVTAMNLYSNNPRVWPESMLGYAIHQGSDIRQQYRSFAFTEDEGAIINLLGQVAQKLISSNPSSPSVLLDAAHILEKKKYPSPKNMPQLFRRLGFSNIFSSISRVARTDSKLLLTSLNDLRTGIAHNGATPPAFSARDFRDRARQMSVFVAALDRVVATHFCQVMRRQQWNRTVT